MTSVFILVAGCFSIPIIIFATSSQDSASDSSVIEILADQFNINECSQQVRIAAQTSHNNDIDIPRAKVPVWHAVCNKNQYTYFQES